MMNRSCVVALCAAIAFVAAPAYAAITISLKPARTSGVSPLYVFFDATGTTSTDVSDPFGDLLYQWNFGDTNPVSGGAAAWKVSGKLKNSATGPLAAHVYECAGPSNCTATVTLTVRAPDGVVNSATTTITVYPASSIDGTAPGSKTVCVSSSGDFTGCPNGAARVSSSADFTSILSSQIDGNGMRRVLFRRGDAWSASGNYMLRASGPGIIGAFGSTGAKPYIEVTSNLGGSALIKCYGFDATGSGSGQDWRIQDLKVRGGPNESDGNGSFIDATYGRTCTQMLVYRVDVVSPAGYSFGVNFGMNVADIPSNGKTHDQVALVQDTADHAYKYHTFWAGSRSALLGNDFENSARPPGGDGHVMRIPCAKKMVIADNHLAGAILSRQELKLHAAGGGVCPNSTSDWIEIADNLFDSQASQWSVTISGNLNPEGTPEWVRDVIFERNVLRVLNNNGSSQAGVLINTTHGIYRNNISIATGASPYRYKAFYPVDPASAVPGGSDNQIFNNTCYAADSGTRYCVYAADGGETNTTIRNNLLYKPNPTEGNGTSSAAVCGGSNCIADHNVSEIGSSSSDPFATLDPAAPPDFKLHASPNAAIGAGVTVPIFEDFGLEMRGATRDAGAWGFDPAAGAAPPAAPVLLP